MGSQFGKLFNITTFGESHGKAVGVVIEGVPAGFSIDFEAIQAQLNRRRPGQSQLTSPRNEPDLVQCLSGVENNVSLGSPLTLLVYNSDQKPSDYQEIQDILRPSHADFTTLAKYGIKSSSGGGRASARETIGRVASGAVAEQILKKIMPHFEVVAWVEQVENLTCPPQNETTITRSQIDQNTSRCPDLATSKKIVQLIESLKTEGDSVGGVIRCVIRGVPPGLGEPVFDKLEADLAKAMMSLPATKGFEIGSGFAGTKLRGSAHNDEFINKNGTIGTKTNHSGGIQGGISNGEAILFNVAFKPVASIAKKQTGITVEGVEKTFDLKSGRHDPCVLPRAVPLVESMAAIVILDHWLRNKVVKL